MHDTKYFLDPETFSPERFSAKVDEANRKRGPTQALNSLDVDDPMSIVFGFGRRY